MLVFYVPQQSEVLDFYRPRTKYNGRLCFQSVHTGVRIPHLHPIILTLALSFLRSTPVLGGGYPSPRQGEEVPPGYPPPPGQDGVPLPPPQKVRPAGQVRMGYPLSTGYAAGGMPLAVSRSTVLFITAAKAGGI